MPTQHFSKKKTLGKQGTPNYSSFLPFQKKKKAWSASFYICIKVEYTAGKRREQRLAAICSTYSIGTSKENGGKEKAAAGKLPMRSNPQERTLKAECERRSLVKNLVPSLARTKYFSLLTIQSLQKIIILLLLLIEYYANTIENTGRQKEFRENGSRKIR